MNTLFEILIECSKELLVYSSKQNVVVSGKWLVSRDKRNKGSGESDFNLFATSKSNRIKSRLQCAFVAVVF